MEGYCILFLFLPVFAQPVKFVENVRVTTKEMVEMLAYI